MQVRTLSKREQAIQSLLDWLTDGEPLTTEAERELHDGRPKVSLLTRPVGVDGRAVARTVLDVAA